MKKYIVFAFLFLVSFPSIYACSCQGITPFCEWHSMTPNENVFIGEILRHDSLYTEFKIIHNLRGAENRTIVKIYDNPSPFNTCVGHYNTESKNIGNVGDSILIILPYVDTSNANNHWGTLGDYYRPLAVCSQPFIPIVGGSLQGLITGSPIQIPQIPDTIPLNQFVTNYVASSNSNDCDIFLGITKVNLNSFKVLPNPTTDFVYVTIDNKAQIAKTELYSINGKLLLSQPSYINKIELSDYPKGIYFLKIELKNGENLSRKVIKH